MGTEQRTTCKRALPALKRNFGKALCLNSVIQGEERPVSEPSRTGFKSSLRHVAWVVQLPPQTSASSSGTKPHQAPMIWDSPGPHSSAGDHRPWQEDAREPAAALPSAEQQECTPPPPLPRPGPAQSREICSAPDLTTPWARPSARSRTHLRCLIAKPARRRCGGSDRCLRPQGHRPRLPTSRAARDPCPWASRPHRADRVTVIRQELGSFLVLLSHPE